MSAILTALLLPLAADASFFRDVKGKRGVQELHASMEHSFVSHSNLGGAGPDNGSEAIHVGGIVASDDERTDLVIIAGSKYSANQPLENGVTHDFGLINFDCNTSAKLWFQFVDSETHMQRNYSKMYVTLYDFDQSKDGMFEEATISGAKSIWVTNTTQLVSTLTSTGGFFRSSVPGTSKDNPRDKENMTQEQLDRSLTILFENTGEFQITLAVLPEENGCSDYGRTFLYDFRPLLVNGTMVQNVDVPAAVEDAGVQFHWPRGILHRNNLGGMGPSIDGLHGLVFKNVAYFDGNNVNFAVSVASGEYEPDRVENNGFIENWGKINGKCGSEVDLRLAFLSEYDGYPLVIPEVMLSLAGIGSDENSGCAVSVSLSNFGSYRLDDTEVVASETNGTTTFSKGFEQTDTESQVSMVFTDIHIARVKITWGDGNSGGRDVLFKIGSAV